MAESAFGTIVGKAGKVLVTDILSTVYDFFDMKRRIVGD